MRESESIKIETSLVKVNTDARYPQAYYDAKKIKNPHEKASDNLDSYTEDTSSDTYFESSSQNNLSSNEAIDREDTLAETSDMPEDTVSSDTVPDGFNTPSDYFVSSSNIASADSSQTETTN